MTTEYSLDLPMGEIHESNRGHIFTGSHEKKVKWNPFNPVLKHGWQPGDTLTVSCSFNWDPKTHDLPPVSNYVGLSVGACPPQVANRMEKKAKGTRTGDGILLGGIAKEGKPYTSRDIFYDAKSFSLRETKTKHREGTGNLICQWQMTYNADNTITNPDTVEIVFGFGDPMWGDNES